MDFFKSGHGQNENEYQPKGAGGTHSPLATPAKSQLAARGPQIQPTNLSPKNKNGTQNNVHIFRSNVLTLLKLGVGLDHMHSMSTKIRAPKQLNQKSLVKMGSVTAEILLICTNLS